jgi:hypothetical protein
MVDELGGLAMADDWALRGMIPTASVDATEGANCDMLGGLAMALFRAATGGEAIAARWTATPGSSGPSAMLAEHALDD